MQTTNVSTSASHFIVAGSLLATLFLPLPSAAQLPSETPDTTVATTSSPEPVVTNLTPWYRINRIPSGNRSFGDLVIGPGKQELSIRPGQTKTFNVTLSNRIQDNQRFKIEVEDVAAQASVEGSIDFLGSAVGPYSIRDFISIPEYQLTLDLGEQAVIPVTVSVPADADPGGRYGSLLFSTVRTPGAVAPGAPQTPLVTRVASLIFLTIEGDIERGGALQDFSTLTDRWWYEEGPIEFAMVFENNGTVHLNPYGEIRITNLLGEEVGAVPIDPWFVLPNSLRRHERSWDRELLLGRYTATLQLNRGYNDIIDTATIHFWVLPWRFLALVFGVVFGVVFVIRYIIKNFEFKRKQ